MNRVTESIDTSISVQWTHRLRFTTCAFSESGTVDSLLQELQPLRLLVVVDEGLATTNDSFTESLTRWCQRTETVCAEPMIVAGGENAKINFSVVDQVLLSIHANDICRKSCILVIGGGAVLDAVGFAASIGHRGIPILRMPSTTLSQGDSGVGVKNGANYFDKKNFIGTFDPPYAVINDSSLLETLTDEHWRSGLSEAIKVALIKDKTLFDEIELHAKEFIERDMDAMVAVLHRSAELHLRHITECGDPFERLEARPLDFGHWAAHKLEQLTNYELSHGDAVAIGLSIDLMCSVHLGFLDKTIADRAISLLNSLGFPTSHPALENPSLLDGIEEFRQHLGGQLTLLMLRDIEGPIDIHQLEHDVVRQVIAELM